MIFSVIILTSQAMLKHVEFTEQYRYLPRPIGTTRTPIVQANARINGRDVPSAKTRIENSLERITRGSYD